MTNVFTYGSLMYPEVFERVALGAPPRVEATLEGWSRHALAGRTYPAAVPLAGSRITGILWKNLSTHAMGRLDAFEGEEYERQAVIVRLQDGACLPAQIYRWRDPAALLPSDWSREDFEQRHLPDFFRIHGT